MAKILRRLSLNARGLLDGFVAPAAVPRRALRDALEAQQELLGAVGAARESLVASISRLKLGLGKTRERLSSLEDQARRDLAAGWEDLARFGLQQLQVAEEELNAVDEQVGEIETRYRRLAPSAQRLSIEIDALASHGDESSATSDSVEGESVRKKLERIPVELANLQRAIEKLEQEVDDLAYRASIVCDVVDLGAPDESERVDAAADVPPQSVEGRLIALKREMGMG